MGVGGVGVRSRRMKRRVTSMGGRVGLNASAQVDPQPEFHLSILTDTRPVSGNPRRKYSRRTGGRRSSRPTPVPGVPVFSNSIGTPSNLRQCIRCGVPMAALRMTDGPTVSSNVTESPEKPRDFQVIRCPPIAWKNLPSRGKSGGIYRRNETIF